MSTASGPRPGFTLKNLMEIESSAPAGSGLQARVGRTFLDSEQLGVSYFRYEAGARTPFGHSHGEQEEVYVVVGGSGRVRLDDQIVELRRWDAIRVAPRVVRALEGGPQGLEVIAIGSGVSEDEGGETIPDFWTGS
jgi:mannose-6-phosphate isomerase-like protein (cupin superfamily)